MMDANALLDSDILESIRSHESDRPKHRAVKTGFSTVPQRLGWAKDYTCVNSFAPLGNLFTTSTGEQLSVGTAPEPQFGAPPAPFADVTGGLQERAQRTLDFSRVRIAVREHLKAVFSEQQLFGSEVVLTLRVPDHLGREEAFAQERQQLSRAERDPFSRVAPRSRVEIALGVEAYARNAGALDDVSIIGELCLRLVPEAQRVFVTVTHDPEDGTTGLHFRVRTLAAIDTVVAAEDQLHEALFARIPVARRSLFSIGYEFLR